MMNVLIAGILLGVLLGAALMLLKGEMDVELWVICNRHTGDPLRDRGDRIMVFTSQEAVESYIAEHRLTAYEPARFRR